MGFSFKKALGKVARFGAPLLGTALGGPLGGALGGALSNALGRGKPGATGGGVGGFLKNNWRDIAGAALPLAAAAMGGRGRASDGGYDYNAALAKARGGKDPLMQAGTYAMDELDRLRNESSNPDIQQVDPERDAWGRADRMARPSLDIEGDPLGDYLKSDFNYGQQRPGFDIEDDALGDLRKLAGDESVEADMRQEIERLRGADGIRSNYRNDIRDIASSNIEAERLGNAPGVEFSGERADTSDLRNFDVDAAFQRNAAGARIGMDQALEDAYRRLTATRAGQGRLTSGFMDLDAGDVGRGISREFQAGVLGKSLEAAGLKQQGIESATRITADDLAALRQGGLEASKANAANWITVGQGNQDAALKAALANQSAALDASKANQSADISAAELGQKGALARADATARMFGHLTTSRDSRMGGMKSAAGLQREDRDARQKAFEGDRDFSFGVYKEKGRRQEFGAETMRGDRDARQKAFEGDRSFLERYGDTQRGDRDYTQKERNTARERYLDWLSASQDRLMGARNAREQRAADARDRRATLWGAAAQAGADILSGRGREKGMPENRWWGNRERPAGTQVDSLPPVDPADDPYKNERRRTA